MLILDGKKVYEKGDIVVKTKVTASHNINEWPVGTRGEITGVRGTRLFEIRNLDALGAARHRHCDMKNWELEKREFQAGDRIRLKDCIMSRKCGIVGCTGVIIKKVDDWSYILPDASDITWKNSSAFWSHWKAQLTFTVDVDMLELFDPTQVSSPAGKKPKRTNDGRDTCFACGNPTQFIGCLPGTIMKECTKCKR